MTGDRLASTERRVLGWLDRRRERRVERARQTWQHCAECGTHLDDSEPPAPGVETRRWCSEECRADWQVGNF